MADHGAGDISDVVTLGAELMVVNQEDSDNPCVVAEDAVFTVADQGKNDNPCIVSQSAAVILADKGVGDNPCVVSQGRPIGLVAAGSMLTTGQQVNKTIIEGRPESLQVESHTTHLEQAERHRKISVEGHEVLNKPFEIENVAIQDNGTGIISASNNTNPITTHSKEENVTDGICTFTTGNATVSDTGIMSSPSESYVSGYKLKRIPWHSRFVPIVTQNENGPCPLIAIANVLLLRGKIVIPPVINVITPQELMEYVADCIMENIPRDLSEAVVLNYEQNMHDAIGVLPHLLTGLDVNIRFTGVADFEYTPECVIFDLLDIPLYHGWLVDPQAVEVTKAIGHLGYNQLVEKIIVNKFSCDENAVTSALIAESFLENTASQLTYHGLCELNTAMDYREVAVLFRNNHFSTIYKRGMSAYENDINADRNQPECGEENELFQLVTDQGFLVEPRVVWETLSNIEGDGVFVDGYFANSPQKPAQSVGFESPKNDVSSWEQINKDLELAHQLQEKDRRSVGSVPSHSNVRVRSPDRRKWGDCCIL